MLFSSLRMGFGWQGVIKLYTFELNMPPLHFKVSNLSPNSNRDQRCKQGTNKPESKAKQAALLLHGTIILHGRKVFSVASLLWAARSLVTHQIQVAVAWGDVQDESRLSASFLCGRGWKKRKLFHTFIAQQATPVPLAVALPLDVAGPVDASRVEHTFITELALPAVATPAKHRRINHVTHLLSEETPLFLSLAAMFIFLARSLKMIL